MPANIAVIGNCQAAMVSKCLNFLSDRVCSQWISTLAHAPLELNGKAWKTLRNLDIVFVQKAYFPPEIGTTATALAEALPNSTLFPFIDFAAFHPDCVYVYDHGKDGAGIQTPLGDYNSAIAFYSYTLGLSPEDAAKRFNERNFSELGYLDLWNSAATALIKEGAAVGYDLAGPLIEWSRSGCFMYSMNHPKMMVMADIARSILERSNIEITRHLIEEYVDDDAIKGPIWPLYPEIGEAYGIRGEYVFRPSIFDQVYSYLSLPEYISASYSSYKEALNPHCARIDDWRARNISIVG